MIHECLKSVLYIYIVEKRTAQREAENLLELLPQCQLLKIRQFFDKRKVLIKAALISMHGHINFASGEEQILRKATVHLGMEDTGITMQRVACWVYCVPTEIYVTFLKIFSG